MLYYNLFIFEFIFSSLYIFLIFYLIPIKFRNFKIKYYFITPFSMILIHKHLNVLELYRYLFKSTGY